MFRYFHQEKLISLKKLSSIILLSILLISSANLYFIFKIKRNRDYYKGESVRLASDLEGTKKEKENIEKEKDISEASLYISKNLAAYFAEKFDELDKILLKGDSNSLDAITWFKKNAQFDNYTLPIATGVYYKWEAIQKETTREYNELQKEILSVLDELKNTADTSL